MEADKFTEVRRLQQTIYSARPDMGPEHFEDPVENLPDLANIDIRKRHLGRAANTSLGIGLSEEGEPRLVVIQASRRELRSLKKVVQALGYQPDEIMQVRLVGPIRAY